MPSFPLAQIEQRISRLQSAMAEQGFSGALIIQTADLYYFSGTVQDAHLLVPTEGEPRLLVRKSLERALEDSPLKHISPLRTWSDLTDAVDSTCNRVESLGMELDILVVNNYRRYVDLFRGVEIKDVSPLIKAIRMIKSPHELEIMGRAAAMNASLFSAVPEILEEGMTELEFAGLLEAYYRKLGHQGLVRLRSFNKEVFYGQVMTGKNLAVPSSSVGPTGGQGASPALPHSAGHKKIGKHEPIQVDYVGVVNGYMVDQARTYFLGEPPEKFLRIHETALEIQQAMVEKGVPGVPVKDLYHTAIEMAEAAGLSEGFMGYPEPVKFVGHGLGLELDEAPVIGPKSPYVLEEGMTIAIEPKFVLPNEGLAGIENTFVVAKEGLTRLTQFDDAIQVI